MDKEDKICEFEKRDHPSNVLRKVVALMETQITRGDICRHSEMIQSYVKKSRNGLVSFRLINSSSRFKFEYIFLISVPRS